MKKMLIFVGLVLMLIGAGCSGKKSESRGMEQMSVSSRNSGGMNTLTATINGSRTTLEMEKAVVQGRRIYVTYASYNPRGKKEFYVRLNFAENIAPGYYSMYDDDNAFSVSSDIAGGTVEAAYKAYRDNNNPWANSNGFKVSPEQGKYQGNYQLNLTERSSDWRTYEGRFDAELESIKARGISQKSVVIENAVFSFTIQ